MRRRQLKRLWTRLKQLSTMALSREELLMKLGAARDQSRTAWRLVTIEVAAEDATFSYRLHRNKLRQTRLRDGRYLLRTNLVEEDPAKLWGHYLEPMAGTSYTRARPNLTLIYACYCTNGHWTCPPNHPLRSPLLPLRRSLCSAGLRGLAPANSDT